MPPVKAAPDTLPCREGAGRTPSGKSTAREDRKRGLLLHLHKTRQRLLRLHVLVSWYHRAKVLREAGRVLDITHGHAEAMRMAADHLAFLHNELEDTRAPAYDVPTALEILQTGAYDLLPTAIAELQGPVPPTSTAKQQAAVRLLNYWLRVQLLKEGLPAGLAVRSIRGGFATLVSRGQPALPSAGSQPNAERERTAQFATDGPDKWRWRLVSIEVLPGLPHEQQLAPTQAESLRAELDARMWAAADKAGQGPSAGQLTDPAAIKLEKPDAAPMPSGPTPEGTPAASQMQIIEPLASRKPLQLMDTVLREISARLALVHMSSWVTQQASDAASRWYRHIAKAERAQNSKLEYGLRVLYWQQAPWLTPEQAQDLMQGTPSSPLAPGAGLRPATPPPGSAAPVTQHSLEVGDPGDGTLTVDSIPALPPLPLADAEGDGEAGEPEEAGSDGAVQRGITGDVITVSVETLLLRVAAANAAAQLGALQAVMDSQGVVTQLGGSVHLHIPAAMQGSNSLQVPELEISAEGQVMVRVAIQLHTGLLLLAAGPGITGPQDSLDIDPVTSVAQDEAKLRQLQETCFAGQMPRADSEKGLTVGQLAVLRLGRLLGDRVVQYALQSRRQALLYTASRLALYPLPPTPAPARDHATRSIAALPTAMMEAYWQAHPSAPRCGTTNVIAFALPPVAPLPPAPDSGSEPKRQAGAELAVQHRRPLLFCLVVDLLARGGWSFWFLAALCNSTGNPMQVVQWQSLPQTEPPASQADAACDVDMVDREHRQGFKRKREEAAITGQPPAGPSLRLLLRQMIQLCLTHAMQCQLEMHLECSQALHQLDSLALQRGAITAPTASNAGDGESAALPCGIWLRGEVHPGTGVEDGHKGAWHLDAHSRYLASLPGSCSAGASAASIAPEHAHIAITSQGLRLRYLLSAGGTPQRALTDLGAITRLHGFLARVLHVMRSQSAASSADGHPAAGGMDSIVAAGAGTSMDNSALPWDTAAEADSKPAAGNAGPSAVMTVFPPGVPQALAAELEAMAEAGEEELMLDALCICSEPLAAIAAVVNSCTASKEGAEQRDIQLSAPEPPYHLRLSSRLPPSPAAGVLEPARGQRLSVESQGEWRNSVWVRWEALQAALQFILNDLHKQS
ncbi:hypothetical protein WJX73_010263 [Symbiochloris irregularis]|uniref:Mediator of RNA polymerase II transcription subunit 14 n=1 Tax=Symbiochloris irregularis TaxID=706552 RepID=A0AAW1NSI8_9CHLO